ncbi:YfcC family protein [Enterococcus raffinosus]|uniref:YfcC family protein n=1 Tax=Enterococcus raffinosus TaxID=71452 RepID=A0AAW8SWW9_9ENTE|nr:MULTISPECIES: YfcC family protein [Enterococcus]SAM75651.1 C4-dicarboxylate anaerobic carrier [Enterococcus faecium]MBS6430355.1 YfcC family protein [Enterococcus raffinosus]MDK7989143.1 YfcC family protein [Enterococcus raffinosus]MDT2536742.1 YfcC family protein [Enterococcus raffinosus]OFU66882.1 C4-dicarboxylate ABC transporter [Enterococcus sp. HMSC14A10]
MELKRKKFVFPHSYTLIFLLIIIAALLTWFIPSGQFKTVVETINGMEKTTVVPGTYHQIDKAGYGQGISAVLEAPAAGVINAVEVVAFVLIVGGAFGIILKTGAVDRGLFTLAQSLGDKGILVIPLSMILFSLGGSTFGMSEEVIPLFAVFVSLMFSLGFDSMTAILILFLGTQAGYIGSTINPFNVLIAQGVADVHGNPLLVYRVVCWAVITLISILFTMHYAKKVKANPESSIVYKNDQKVKHKFQNFEVDKPFSTSDKWIIGGFIIGLMIMIWGIIAQGWYMVEISALFVGMGLYAGLVARFNQKEIAEAFVEGCADFAYAAVIIGLARGVLVILENGMIIDTILNCLANLLGGLPKFMFSAILLIAQVIVTFFVPSSSGAAALTMPVMAPLADLVHINRDVVVLSNQFGNGLMNLISPTGGVLLAGLAIAEINFSKWLKVGSKIFVILLIVSAVLLYIATLL